MPPIILTLLQGLLLVLLYLFVARAVRAVVRDVRAAGQVQRRAAPAGRRDRRGDESPRRRQPPSELVIHAADGRPRVVALDSSEVTFGRDESATVVLSDPYVSDFHARIYPEGTDWLVADVGSTNGTFINRSKVTAPTPISAGDQLGIGKTVVEVRR